MLKLKTLRAKFICVALVIVSVVTLAICGLIYFMVGGMLSQSVFDGVEASTSRSAHEISNWLNDQNIVVDYMQNIMHALSDNDSRRDVFVSLDHMAQMYIGFVGGGFISGGDWVAPEGFPIGRPWFEGSLAQPTETYITAPYVDAITGGLIITVARYIGALEGVGTVFGIDLPMDDVLEIVYESTAIPGAYSLLANRDGTIILHTRRPDLSPYAVGGDTLFSNMWDIHEYRQFLDAEPATNELVRLEDTANTRWYMSYYAVEGSDWLLLSAIPAYYLQVGINRLMLVVLLVAVPAAALMLIIIWFAVNRAVSRPINNLKEAALQVAGGNFAVNFDITRTDEIGQIAQAFAEILKSLNVMEENFLEAVRVYKHGDILYRLEDSRLGGTYAELLQTVNDICYEFVLTLDNVSEALLYIDQNYKVLYANNVMQEHSGKGIDEIVGMHINDLVQGDLARHPSTVAAIRDAKPQAAVEMQLQLNPQQLFDLEYNCVPFTYDGEVVCLLILLANVTRVRDIQRHTDKLTAYRNERTEKLTATIVTAFEQANLAVSIPRSDFDDDTREIALAQDAVESVVQRATDTIKGYVDEITGILQKIADNNFNIRIGREYIGDFGSIKDSIGMIVDSISALVSEIQASTAQVSVEAGQISQSTQALLANFEEQTAATSEARQAIDVLAQKTQKNATDAKSASTLSEHVQDVANIGSQRMQDMSEIMKEIEMSSAEIAKVAGAIEGIAFQTNLLALNASVEAARAGEHGRGFAVVADEVRSLAGRSAAAAKETSEMVANSMRRVGEGTAKSEETAQALQKIVEVTDDVANVIANIATVSAEQAEEISKIQDSMEIIHQGVSQNTASVQDNASASEELSNQANTLMALVDRFKI